MLEKQSAVLNIEMMGLQTAIKEIKATTKRKYEIETDREINEKKEASPPKTQKFSEALKFPSSHIIMLNNKSNGVTLKSIKSDIISPETHHWSNEPLDSISKLQAVTETWSNTTLNAAPFNCTSSTLNSLAQTAENITRSTLATTLLDQDDLLDDDEDDFQDDFDFDDDDDDDLLLDDHTLLNNQNYTPIRYPSPSPVKHHYIPAYPKPGYVPESYQNCSRTPTLTQYSNHMSQPHLRSPFFQGTNNGGASYNYYNHHHHHYDLGSHQQQQLQQQTQTIRCAENGKSYFELGSSNNYCSSNRFCNNGIGMMKNCCEGRNNLWCTAKQCYKEKRLKMMNLSMFKLARFRQASDQSLYRSVLICNTLKSLEKEIELENQIYHQRMQHHRQTLQNQQNIEYNQSFPPRPTNTSDPKQQQHQNSGHSNNNNNNNNNNASRMVHCNLSTCNNNSFSQQPYNATTPSLTNNCIINRIQSINDHLPLYEHHPLKDTSSGRATPFPFPSVATTPTPIISQQESASNSSVNSTNSAFGDDVDGSSTRSIDWGSVLSLSSQSALDPLSNNDIFTSTTTTSLTQTSTTQQNSSTVTNLQVTISNNSNNSNSNHTSPTNTITSAATSSTPISSIITTLTTVSSCSLESLTASSISVNHSVSNVNWDFPYLETESNNSDFYELNCYKLSSALNQMDDFVKSEQLTPISSSVSPTSANDLEQSHHQINIMVGS